MVSPSSLLLWTLASRSVLGPDDVLDAQVARRAGSTLRWASGAPPGLTED
jgi:hypothetical protein